MVDTHHAALALICGQRAEKKILGDLNFGWTEFYFDPVACGPVEKVPTFRDHKLALRYPFAREETHALDTAAVFLDLAGENRSGKRYD